MQFKNIRICVIGKTVVQNNESYFLTVQSKTKKNYYQILYLLDHCFIVIDEIVSVLAAFYHHRRKAENNSPILHLMESLDHFDLHIRFIFTK